MADDTRDSEPKAAATAGTTTSAGSSGVAVGTRLPKGMVMGKDGKPCRACTSFADFTSLTKPTTAKSLSTGNNTLGSSTARLPADCPPDVEALGRSTWTLLHSITATYPVAPTAQEQRDVTQFVGLLGRLYPCWVCAEDFQAFMEKSRVRASSREEFGTWMCEAHNEVNRKLGKEEFDCRKWEERWRTGWKDGRCG